MSHSILFYTEKEFLNKIPCPDSASKFLPKWFQESSVKTDENYPLIRNNASMKTCPGIVDSFNQGYIVPAWCDFSISFNRERQELKLNTEWPYHFATVFPPEMYSKFSMPVSHKGVILKITTPWRIETSANISVEIKKPVWREINNFNVYEGIVDSDTFVNEVHAVISFDEDRELVFKKGDPLLQIVPFVRDNFKISIKEWGQQIHDKYAVQQNQLDMHEISSYKKLFWNSKDYK
jgi:hypothetical protein